jgi:hypothetical protein
LNVADNNAFKIAAGETIVIKKDIIAVVVQILKDSYRPGCIVAAIANENRLFYAGHAELASQGNS